MGYHNHKKNEGTLNIKKKDFIFFVNMVKCGIFCTFERVYILQPYVKHHKATIYVSKVI